MTHEPHHGIDLPLLDVPSHGLTMTPGANVNETVDATMRASRQPLIEDVSLHVTSGEVEGLSPTGVFNLAPGEVLTILGKASKDATLEARGTFQGKPWTQSIGVPASTKSSDHPLLANFWARARLAQMERDEAPRAELVKLSLEYGVLSPYTSFLVLENDEAYERFQIERRKQEEIEESDPDEVARPETTNLKKQDGDLQDLLNKDREQRVVTRIRRVKKRRARRRRSRKPMRSGFIIEPGDPWSDSLAEDIKELEKRRKTLDEDDCRELLELYVRTRQIKKARAWFATARRMKDVDTLALLEDAGIRVLFATEYLDAAQKALASGDADSDEVLSNVTALLSTKAAKSINARRVVALIGFDRPAADAAGGLLAAYAKRDKKVLVRHWKTLGKGRSNTELLTLLEEVPSDVTQRDTLRLAALRAAAAKGRIGGARERELIELVLETPDWTGLDKAIGALCVGSRADMRWCGALFTRITSDATIAKTYEAEVAGVLAPKARERMKQLRKERAEDMGNRWLIEELALQHALLAEFAQARRVLSEIVEFAPHDYAARTAYASALAERTLPIEACTQYATAVQLEPSQRDTFRTMMTLRRTHEDRAKELRECIVQGVSNLPVRRAVSIVVTWEDPDADVDTHIYEQGGEHVYFSDRESEQGGLLYYDITDGYGPEIYVLGSGRSGKYRMAMVYYDGDRKNIKGTLTLMRNVGSANETRKDYPFTLPRENSSVEIPVGSFKLTARDNAGDDSRGEAP